jgi:mono/diheme cytochrome c family protein
VLPVILFVAFWVVLAVALFFVAIRGGVGGARRTMQTQTRGGRKTFRILFFVVYALFGVAIPLAILVGNHANANSQVGGYTLTANEKAGRVLFSQNCGVCHTLAAANAVGKIGPNLDQLAPSASFVLHTINNGCLQNAPGNSQQACLGYGTMPSQILQGRQAEQVAEFVARVAGRE